MVFVKWNNCKLSDLNFHDELMEKAIHFFIHRPECLCVPEIDVYRIEYFYSIEILHECGQYVRE